MTSATLVTLVRALVLATRRAVVDPRAAALAARMALWIVLVSVLARLTTLPRVQGIVSARLRAARIGDAADREETAQRLARTIDSLLRLDLLAFRRRCWVRALVLHRFLALHGIESRLNFGVRKAADGSVQGHAWLEHQGRPLLEDNASAYIVTFSLPHPRRSATWGIPPRR